METESKSNSNKRLIIILVFITVIIAIVAIAAVMILRDRGSAPAESVNIADGGTSTIGYAEGTIAIDEESLQAAVDEMMESSGEGFVTEYTNDAFSNDGEVFSCYVGNSEFNTYDMYIQIFADEALTDQLFLSGLLRPATVFEEIKLDHPLDPGDHMVYVFFTQVGEDHATLVGQYSVTMDFHVSE